jgi:CelD/BcsL family acetyltransferase involved in cellulose biosynthesis
MAGDEPGTVQAGVQRSPEAFESLRPDWSNLDQASADPLLSFRWFSAASRMTADPGLHVVTVHRDGALAAVAPLAATAGRRIRRLELIGSRALYEPGGLLAQDESAMAALCQAIVDLRLPTALMRLERDGPAARALAACCRRRGILLKVSSPPTLYVDLQSGWDQYLATRPARVLADHRRKVRRLQAAGRIRFHSIKADPAKLPELLDEAFDVEADGWKGKTGSAMRFNDPIRRFVSCLADEFARTSQLQIDFLRVNDTAIAMDILLEHDGKLWEIKKGYREGAQQYSPGMLLLHETLRDLCNRGLKGYEFLGSGDRLQADWATGRRELQTLVYYPYDLGGARALIADVLGRWRRRRRRQPR